VRTERCAVRLTLLVAGTGVRDLLDRAKLLFVAAIVTRPGTEQREDQWLPRSLRVSSIERGSRHHSRRQA
jgi:hypothetical protein